MQTCILNMNFPCYFILDFISCGSIQTDSNMLTLWPWTSTFCSRMFINCNIPHASYLQCTKVKSAQSSHWKLWHISCMCLLLYMTHSLTKTCYTEYLGVGKIYTKICCQFNVFTIKCEVYSNTYLMSTWLKSRVDILATFPGAETGRVVWHAPVHLQQQTHNTQHCQQHTSNMHN